MSVHDLQNNLGEIETPDKIIDIDSQICNDNNNEVIVLNNDNITIHEEELDNNIITCEISDPLERSQQNNNNVLNNLRAIQISKIKSYQMNKNILKRRNDIMRSINNYNRKSTNISQQYIKTRFARINNSSPSSSTADNRLKMLRAKTINERTTEGLPLYSSPEILKARNVIHNNVDSNKSVYKVIEQFTEKPKEINLSEIITSVLQEVLLGKIKSIEDVIGKIRVSFEEKNVFTNANKKNIILLNFEDDTTIPVLEIEEKYMSVINKWYEDCNLILDIENTNLSIPEVITHQDISGVLFQEINYKFKDEFLNKYLPIIINNIISNRTIKEYERKYFTKSSNSHSDIIRVKNSFNNSNELISLNIQIPDNIKCDSNMNDNKEKNSNLPKFAYFNNSNYISRIDPEILVKKHILSNNCEKQTIDTTLNINCYNALFEKDSIEQINEYNHGYNSLSPNFSDNCEIIDNVTEHPSKSDDNKLIVVIFNNKFLQTISIENPNSNELYIIKNHPEFGFIKLFSILTNNKDIVQFINREFNKSQFNDIEEINKKLLVTSQYIDFSNKHITTNNITISEENQVKKYIDNTYKIDGDINNRMKASYLHDAIIKSKCVSIESSKISGFQTRLSRYLKELGLLKKRYNDGYYYYGIQYKNYGTNIKITDEDFKKIVCERDNLFTEISYKFPKTNV
jgi:hypothetical protein